MSYQRKYFEANRDKINERRRANYNSEKRIEEYTLNKEEILRKGREDRALCPFCKLDFRRPYIRRHIVTRHKIEVPENLDELIASVTPK